jgi:hypothetical protein
MTMHPIRSSALHRRARTHRFDLGRALAVVITSGLVGVIIISLAVAVAVGAGIAPAFDQSIALPAQRQLLIHIGPRPTCWLIPNPPQHDCLWPGAERGVFSVDYLTPRGARSLVWFRLPSWIDRAELSAPDRPGYSTSSP